MPQHAANAVRERIDRRQQADDEERFAWEVEEVSRVHEDALGLQQVEHHRLFTMGCRHPDDSGKEDVVALDPAEDVVISRRFRTFTGPYVAHCHNLAHEDHNMMFGWEITP